LIQPNFVDYPNKGDAMFLELKVGNLHEPITGRGWEKKTIYEEFENRVRLLQIHGVSGSDRVLIHYGNNIEFFVDLLAIWYLGGSAIPIDSRLTPFEVENIARVAQPRFSLWGELVDEPVASVLRGLGVKIVQTCVREKNTSHAFASPPPKSEFSLDQEALILFTSGTTGQPKGVVHTHRTLRARWMSLRENLGIERFRRSLCLLPTHFGHGLICNCLFPWLSAWISLFEFCTFSFPVSYSSQFYFQR
jgi:acyl-CoA synthetase (AMP-forming)/AMP-acid ligase II